MANARLTYSVTPAEVAISTDAAPSIVGMTFTIENGTSDSVLLAQVVLTLPQGPGPADLLAPGTSITTGSVHSSNGTSWSSESSGNVVTLSPISPQGALALAPQDTLQFTLSALQINAAGAGKTAVIAVVETDNNAGPADAAIKIDKVNPGFQIEAFSASLYNVTPNSPVTITWKVFQALSCEITATPLSAAAAAAGSAPVAGRAGPCGLGTGNPNCDGTIASGTEFSGTNTCNVIGPTLFTLTALGKSGGQDMQLASQLLVAVNQSAIEFSGFPPSIKKGQSVALRWRAADAALLQLYIVPSGQQATVIDLTRTPMGTRSDVPQVDTTYNLYAFANATDSFPAKQLSVPVGVLQPAWQQPPAVSNLPSPAYPGDAFALAWQVANVSTCGLTADVAAFAPIANLPIAGSQTVTIPDPGVSAQTATFTLTPVMYGQLGNFTAQSFQIPIQNTPHFSKPLAASPASGGPGATMTLTWAVDHADAGTLVTDCPGTAPVTVDPASGTQTVQLPNIVVPTPIVYELVATRGAAGYKAISNTAVQVTGNVVTKWCRNAGATDGDLDYLPSLYHRFPNQRITKIGLGDAPQHGGFSVYVWYSQNSVPDYAIPTAAASGPSATLALQPGEFITSIDTIFDNSQPFLALLVYVAFGTSQGRSISVGDAQWSTPDRESQAADPGQQAIAIAWSLAGGVVGALGIVTCSNTYGA